MYSNKIRQFISSNFFKYIAAEFLGVLVTFIIATFILIKLGPEDLGKYSFFLLLAGFFSTCSQAAANSYLMKNFFQEAIGILYPNSIVNVLFFGCLTVLFYYILSGLYSDINIYVCLPIVFLLKAFNSLPFTLLRLKGKANLFFVYSLLYRFLYALPLTFFIVQKQFNIEILFEIILWNELLFFVLLQRLSRKLIGHFESFFLIDYRDSLKLSFALLPHKITKSIYENIDKYVIQYFMGYEVFGLYSMITRLVAPIKVYIKSANNELSVVMAKVLTKKNQPKTVLASLEIKIYILFSLLLITNFIFAYLYHEFIYNLGDDFGAILFLLISLYTGQLFYIIFYNDVFYRAKKISYYIQVVFLGSFVTGIFLLNQNLSLVNIVSTLLLTNLFGLALLYMSSSKVMTLTTKVFVIYSIFLLIGYIWLI